MIFEVVSNEKDPRSAEANRGSEGQSAKGSGNPEYLRAQRSRIGRKHPTAGRPPVRVPNRESAHEPTAVVPVDEHGAQDTVDVFDIEDVRIAVD